jgi:hypothetical protein
MNQSKKTEKFRSIGLDVINKQRINNISEFLNNSSDRHKNDAQQNPMPKNDHTDIKEERGNFQNKIALGRIHIQIRQDLIDQLLKTVFERKRNHKATAREATQRAIIEEALEEYFERKENIGRNASI